MSYTLCIPISLGSSKTELTLAAQLVDDAGADYGGEITTGFAEIGGGSYLWKHTAFTEGFRGGVKFYESGASGTILAFTAINPQETEPGSGLAEMNVDSTGGEMTLAKAIEVIAARCVGNLAYDAQNGEVAFYGRDGLTAVATVKLTGGGNRTESSIP